MLVSLHAATLGLCVWAGRWWAVGVDRWWVLGCRVGLWVGWPWVAVI